ncbi:hypothetical protein BGZ59_006594, partial [Podila verticillata]
ISIPKNSTLIFGGTGAVRKCSVHDALASKAYARVLTLSRSPVITENSFVNTTYSSKTQRHGKWEN